MHSHTRGSDGTGTPEQIAKEARRAGLHALCLTDHHQNVSGECLATAEALKRVGVMPIIGVEYSTAQGHLLVYGIDVPYRCEWGVYPQMQAVIDEVNQIGGVCVVPHPYAGYTRTIGDHLPSIRGLAAIEGLNGRTESHRNSLATKMARQMGLPSTAGSDAHSPGALGSAWTEFDGKITNESQFLAALRAGSFRAVAGPDVWRRNHAPTHHPEPSRESARAEPRDHQLFWF